MKKKIKKEKEMKQYGSYDEFIYITFWICLATVICFIAPTCTNYLSRESRLHECAQLIKNNPNADCKILDKDLILR